MMEAAKHWKGNDIPTCVNSLNRAFAWLGNTLVDALVRPRAIEVLHILLGHAPQVHLADNQKMIKTVAADAAQ